jgi:outer membrane protein assembly factor BamB
VVGCWLVAMVIAGAVSGRAAAPADQGPADQGPRPRWRHDIPGWGEPAADGEKVYVLTNAHRLIAFDRATGAMRWSARTEGTGAGTWGSKVRLVRSLVVVGDGSLYAFEAASGRPMWRFEPPSGGSIGPYLGDADDDLVFAGSQDGRLFAVEASTGALRWVRRVGRGADTIVLAPASAGRVVVAAYVSSGRTARGGLVGFDRAGRRRWHRALPAGDAPAAPALHSRGLAVLASTGGAILACRLETGRVVWRLPSIAPGRRDVRALAVTEDTLVAGSVHGDVRAYDLRDRRERWRAPSGSDGVPLRLLATGPLLLAPFTSGTLVALSLDDGVERWRLAPPGNRLDWPPVVAGDLLVAAGDAAIGAWTLEAR